MPKSTPYVDTAFFNMPTGTTASPIGGGRNSQVFLLEMPGRDPIVFKRYFVDPRDKRDRQGTEAKALKFLDQAGVRESPHLLTLDTDRQATMLSYVEGEKVTDPTEKDMDHAAEFMVKLIDLSGEEEARKGGFSPASEAFFSAAGVLENIRTRLVRLDGVDTQSPLCDELRVYLKDKLHPAFARYAEACARKLSEAGMTIDGDIPEAWRILSPSDFGVHNAVRRPDGGLSFFDYEYFGWDDPSRMLADFCLYPGMDLPDALQGRFLMRVLPALEASGYRSERAEAMFPLFGIKWCCVLLNEFVPHEPAMHTFAKTDRTDAHIRVLRQQLDKARWLLENLDGRADTFSRLMASV